MRILVTGGAGFIGRWVTESLIEQGDHVWIIDNLSNSSIRNIQGFREKIRGFIKGDIRWRTPLSKLFKKKFDTCVHLAADNSVSRSLRDSRGTFETNATGTFNILEEARRTDTKVVYVSTGLVYSAGTGRAISEDHPTDPRSPYAASKLAGENISISYYHAYSLPVTILRPFNTYGPYQKDDSEGGVVSVFVRQKLLNQDLTVFGDGTQTRDLLYVTDSADFITRASKSNEAVGQILNAGSGVEISIKELALTISGDPTRIRFTPHHHPQSEISRLVCDYSKARKMLGWQPKTSIREGLERMVNWKKLEFSKYKPRH